MSSRANRFKLGSTFAVNNESKRIEWVKPIMFSGGIGQMLDCHKDKISPSPGMLVVKIGGPAYKIGTSYATTPSSRCSAGNPDMPMLSALNAEQPEGYF
jgi:phosphoribosylformylglycinamidine (FGAM) synthase-like enzyme